MNRILLVPLAIALASAGCHSSCDAGDLTFYWRFVGAPIAGQQQRTAGDFTAANNGCAQAGIDGIDVTFDDGSSFQLQYCGDQGGNVGIPGVTFAGTLRGTYGWRLDAIRANQVVFSQSGTTDVRSCGVTAVDVDLQAVSPSPMVVYYDVSGQPPTNCQVGGVRITNVAFELRDATNRIVDSSCSQRSPPVTGQCVSERGIACDASLGFVTTSVPVGSYTMNYLELWQGTGNTTTALAQVCGASFVYDGFPASAGFPPLPTNGPPTFDLAPATNGFCPTTPASGLVAGGAAAL